MNRAKAQYIMRQPRKCRILGNVIVGNAEARKALEESAWQAWYYVEGEGLDIMVRKPGSGTVAVKITKRQMQQALKLIESAHNG